MKLIPALLTTLTILLTGCTTPTGTTLKASCDALGPIMTEFGQAMPDQQRYTTFLLKVQAIADAGDSESRTAIAPLLTAFEDGSRSNAAALIELAAASVALTGKCQAAGSTAYALATPTPSPAATLDRAECSPVSDQVVKAILDDSDRTATAQAAVRTRAQSWLVALKLRNGDVGVWLVDSIIDASTILSADVTAHTVSGWGLADSDQFTSSALANAKACVA